MTKTIQTSSRFFLGGETGKASTISKGKEEDNIDFLPLTASNMDKLGEALSQLNNVVKKRSMEKTTLFGSLDMLNEALSKLDNVVNYYAAKSKEIIYYRGEKK